MAGPRFPTVGAGVSKGCRIYPPRTHRSSLPTLSSAISGKTLDLRLLLLLLILSSGGERRLQGIIAPLPRMLMRLIHLPLIARRRWRRRVELNFMAPTMVSARRRGHGGNNNDHFRGGFADRGCRSQHGHNMVWTRGFPEGLGNSQFHGGSGTLPAQPEDRWEVTVAARVSKATGNRIPDSSRPGAGGNSNSSSTSIGIQGNTGNPGMTKEAHCVNCNGTNHFTASCPTIICERCTKSGHIR